MKILTVHADFISFQAKKKAFKGAEEGVSEKEEKVEECLVVFTAVEKRDENNPKEVLKRYVQEIKNIAQQINAQKIVLYPYAHLSSSLSKPAFAEEFLKKAEVVLQEKYEVKRAPFGWYKRFNISCKGHPLSELSREFGIGEEKRSEKGIESDKNKRSESEGKKQEEKVLEREYKDEAFVFSDEQLSEEERVTYSTALVTGVAVKRLFPETKLGSLGFYHDQCYVDIAGVKLVNKDLAKISAEMKKVVAEKIEFSKKNEVQDKLQQEILNDVGAKPGYQLENVTIVPLFEQPFVNSTSEIKAFKLLNIASAYWKGNEKNEQLTRIYCVGFASEEELDIYLKKQEDAEARSHLRIGKEQGLFVISDYVGAGLPMLAPKGMILRAEIVKYLWELHKDCGYKRVWTPHIAKKSLYEKSGHWDKFGDELFKVQGKSDLFVMKPMNCPHHMQIYDSFSFSYRDLPIRYFEPATVYRDEKSGQLLGLTRVRAITQDDGHLFCRVSQIKEEVSAIIGIVREFYQTMGMNDYWVALSIRGEDKNRYLGGDDVWEKAEIALEEAAQKNNLNFRKVKGEAAFYGPKLDFNFKDALGREWQLATIQCDFNLPERFNLSFMNEESKKERPIVIHRAISGALERFMAVMIEHFAGKFPLWLSPIQVKIVTVTDRNVAFAEDVLARMRVYGIRAEIDDRSESIGKKVRDAQIEKVNYIVTIGDKEVDAGKLAVKGRVGDVQFGVDVEQFISKLKKEIGEKVIG